VEQAAAASDRGAGIAGGWAVQWRASKLSVIWATQLRVQYQRLGEGQAVGKEMAKGATGWRAGRTRAQVMRAG